MHVSDFADNTYNTLSSLKRVSELKTFFFKIHLIVKQASMTYENFSGF